MHLDLEKIHDMKHVGIEVKFYNLDTFKKQIDVNFIDLDSELVDLNYKDASLIFCHFWRSIMQEGCIMLFTYYSFLLLLFCRNEKGLLNFVSERIIFLKLVYRINNTRYSFKKNKLPHTFKFRSISKYQLLLHWKSFKNI